MMMKTLLKNKLVLLLILSTFYSIKAQNVVDFKNPGRDWYVSKTTGTGKLGTKEQPAKDLGNIIYLLQPNDRIHIAEGVYMSKGKRGSDEINVPVQIYGGYDTTFSKRAPWTEHKTIFTGTNEYKKLTTPRLYIRTDQQRDKTGQLAAGGAIIVDGIIVDNGPRNRYHQNKGLAIRRKASPKSQQNPSPESGGIVIVASHYMNVAVQNCIVMNTAPTEGAISVRVKKAGKAYIQNNLSINNTGYGIHARTGYVGDDPKLVPSFLIQYNTSVFNWKHDPIASYGGNALALDRELTATINQNVLGFGHFGGIYNKGAQITLTNNLFTGNSKYDYKEINDEMIVSDIVDEAERIDPSSTGNNTALLQIAVGQRWAKLYGERKELSREAVDASVSAANSGANQLRGMLGLNLQGNSTSMDAEIFLHRLEIEEAIPVGLSNWNGIGCATPRIEN